MISIIASQQVIKEISNPIRQSVNNEIIYTENNIDKYLNSINSKYFNYNRKINTIEIQCCNKNAKNFNRNKSHNNYLLYNIHLYQSLKF